MGEIDTGGAGMSEEKQRAKPRVLDSGHCHPECLFLKSRGGPYGLTAKCKLTGEELSYCNYFIATCDKEGPG